ncbi:MAG TPA: alanine racemase, partial [Coriobacteriia bacterium]|nr:alanine racemase [Coriobacteriia bacterium]
MAYRRFAWAEIQPSAIARNVRTLKRLTARGTLFMAVVKADGYGHGALMAARAALGAGADRLGVATLEEAATLREAGITAPLHLLSEPPVSGAGLAVELDVISAVTTLEFATALSTAACRVDRSVRYHLKIDSGMSRIGVRAEEAPGMAVRLAALPGLEMEGVFTHFATADVPGDWEFERQIERFTRAVEQMK